jgi:hypothetical protein
MSLPPSEFIKVMHNYGSTWVVRFYEDIDCPICKSTMHESFHDSIRIYWCGKCQPLCPRCNKDIDYLCYDYDTESPICEKCDYYFNTEIDIKDPGYD